MAEPEYAFKVLEDSKYKDTWKDSLTQRINDPSKIHQQRSPLCGPAAFMYCIARTAPETYRKYVEDLAYHGEAMLGSLHVKPRPECLNETAKNIRDIGIDPVDWIALASLRDSSNDFLSVTAGSSLAGITLPSTLADWFRQSGLFPGGVSKQASTSSTEHGLDSLIEANCRHRSGSCVCLFLRAAIIGGGGRLGINKLGGKDTPKTWSGAPDHWVVLVSDIHLGRQQNLIPFSCSLPRTDGLEDEPLRARIYTWGRERPMSASRVGNFLPYYYGFVGAARR